MAILQIRFDRFDVSTEVPILLSFFGMGQLVEVGLSAEFQIACNLFTADVVGIHRPEHGATRLAGMGAVAPRRIFNPNLEAAMGVAYYLALDVEDPDFNAMLDGKTIAPSAVWLNALRPCWKHGRKRDA